MKSTPLTLVILIFLSIVIFPSFLCAQKNSVKGNVVDSIGAPIEHVSIIITKLENSVKHHIETDSMGIFNIDLLKGKYEILFSLMGFETNKFTIVVADRDVVIKDVVLKVKAQTLREAVITESRLEYNAIGYTLFVKNNQQLANRNLTEILRFSPGISNGKNNFRVYDEDVMDVYIDHRRLRMSGEDLVAYLNLHKGKQIDKIEVIVNAPAKYGESVVGKPIIKIVTIKENGGTFHLSSRYNGNDSKTVFSPSSGFTYRNGGLSIYGNVRYLYLDSENGLKITDFSEEGEIIAIEKQNKKLNIPYSYHGTLGVAYDVTSKDFLAIEYYGLTRKRDERQQNLTKSLWGNFNTGLLKYERTISNLSSFNITADLGDYGSDIDLDISDSSSVRNKRSYISLQADYKNSFFGRKDNFSAGVIYYALDDNTQGIDSFFDYSEKLSSLFLSYSYNFSRIAIASNIIGTYYDINSKSYFKIVPTFSLRYFINRRKGNLLNLSFSRRFTRPMVSMLNPVPIIGENQFINIGNPNLKPFVTNNFSYRLTLKNKFYISGSYSKSSDVYYRYIYKDSEQLYSTFLNGASSSSVTFGVGASLNPYRWLSFNGSLAARLSELSQGSNKVDSRALSYNMSSMINLPRKVVIDMLIIGEIGETNQINSSLNQPLMIMLSMSKMLLKDRFRLNFEISDVLNSNRDRVFNTYFDNYSKEIRYTNSSTTYTLSLSMDLNWGKKGLRAKKIGPSHEARQRVSD